MAFRKGERYTTPEPSPRPLPSDGCLASRSEEAKHCEKTRATDTTSTSGRRSSCAARATPRAWSPARGSALQRASRRHAQTRAEATTTTPRRPPRPPPPRRERARRRRWQHPARGGVDAPRVGELGGREARGAPRLGRRGVVAERPPLVVGAEEHRTVRVERDEESRTGSACSRPFPRAAAAQPRASRRERRRPPPRTAAATTTAAAAHRRRRRRRAARRRRRGVRGARAVGDQPHDLAEAGEARTKEGKLSDPNVLKNQSRFDFEVCSSQTIWKCLK